LDAIEEKISAQRSPRRRGPRRESKTGEQDERNRMNAPENGAEFRSYYSLRSSSFETLQSTNRIKGCLLCGPLRLDVLCVEVFLSQTPNRILPTFQPEEKVDMTSPFQ
jgi:hypothetical protein